MDSRLRLADATAAAAATAKLGSRPDGLEVYLSAVSGACALLMLIASTSTHAMVKDHIITFSREGNIGYGCQVYE